MKERVESIKQDVADTIQNHKWSIDQSAEMQIHELDAYSLSEIK